MKVAFTRFMLRLLGRAYEVRQPEPLTGQSLATKFSTDSDNSAPNGTQSTDWVLSSVDLKAGWYMLEVEHAADSIGCVMTLKPANGDTAHLRLGSKSVCKRIVWLSVNVGEMAVSIDQPACSLIRLTLVALSSSFALSRVKQRLDNRGAYSTVTSPSTAAIYQLYQSQLNGSIFNKPYRYSDRKFSSDLSPDSGCESRQAWLKVRLSRVSGAAGLQAEPCKSVGVAVSFARRMGWSVEWEATDAQDKISGALLAGSQESKEVFLMPIHDGVQYRPDAIHQLLNVIDEQTVLAYADHDHVGETGQHTEPVLKPDWNPELLLNCNYIDLPWLVAESWFDDIATGMLNKVDIQSEVLLAAALGRAGRSPMTAKVDTCPEAVEGQRLHIYKDSQSEYALKDDQVRHIPMILASKMLDRDLLTQDSSTVKACWQKSVEAALIRADAMATVSCGNLPDTCRVSWPLPMDRPAVDIIIPSRDKVEVLRKCLDSILTKTNYPDYRIVIVDNNSEEQETRDYYQSLEKDKRITLLGYQQEFNYSAINNHAVEQTDAPVLVLLNNDTEVISEGWLDELVRQAIRSDVGCVGAKLYYSNGRIQHAGVVVGITGVAGHAFRYEPGDLAGYCGRLQVSQNYTAVTAACLAVRREVFLQVGGLDQEGLSVAWNDVDFCMKVQASGLRNVWTPYAELFHHEGLSRGSDDTPEKVERVRQERSVMLQRWKLDGYHDPAYHPLLTRDNESFGLGVDLT